MDRADPIYVELQRFANDHKVILQDRGECGFGRPCVGFVARNGHYVDWRPFSYATYGGIEGFEGYRFGPPKGVEDAYHKQDCLAVLAHGEEGEEDYDEALRQLYVWIKHLESLGALEIVQYQNGASGMQMLMSGLIGYAVRIRQSAARP